MCTSDGKAPKSKRAKAGKTGTAESDSGADDDTQGAHGPPPQNAEFNAYDERVQRLLNQDPAQLRVVATAERVLQLLERMGLSYRMQIAPRLVGWDKANRGGEGGNADAAIMLMGRFAIAGWSWRECNGSICVEVGSEQEAQEKFNRRLCRDNALPPVPRNSLLYTSLAGGHTNMGLRAIGARMPNTDPLLSQDGKYCPEKIAKEDPEFGDAIENGLRWLVLRAEVRTRYPKALDIIQAGPT